ncbi:MAG: hypothetical protein WC890_07435 [Candidatus Margulisiibacteriota bacterium]
MLYAILPLTAALIFGGCRAPKSEETAAPVSTTPLPNTSPLPTTDPVNICRGPEPAFGQIDFDLGTLGNQGEAKLSRIKVEEKLDKNQMSLAQLEEMVNALTQKSIDSSIITDTIYSPDDLFRLRPELKTIQDIDKKYEDLNSCQHYHLFDYFYNSNYWANAIILLSLLAQKYMEVDDKDKMQKCVEYCHQFKARIERQRAANKSFLPAEYFVAILDLTEADIKAQTKGEKLTEQITKNLAAASIDISTLTPKQIIDEKRKYYLAARDQAFLSIQVLINTKNKFFWPSEPDYFSIPKATVVLGDLEVKLKEIDREEIAHLRQNESKNHKAISDLEKECVQLTNIAYQLYDSLEDIKEDKESTVDLSGIDLGQGLTLYGTIARERIPEDELNNLDLFIDPSAKILTFKSDMSKKDILLKINASDVKKETKDILIQALEVFTFTTHNITTAIASNTFRGYLNQAEEAEALLGIFHYLRAVTLLKKYALASQILSFDPKNYPPELRVRFDGPDVKARTGNKLKYLEEAINAIGVSVTEQKALTLTKDLIASLGTTSTISPKALQDIAYALEYAFPPFDTNHQKMIDYAKQLRELAKQGPIDTPAERLVLENLLQKIADDFQTAIDAQGATVYSELSISAKKSNDFFFAFGNVVKADLYLAYADYYKFPLDLPSERGKLNISDRYVYQAKYLYSDHALYTNEGKKSAHPFKYLNAWAVTKLAEIDIRFADHLTRQSQVINSLAGVSSNFEEAEYLRAELMHLQAVLFISRCTKRRVTMLRSQSGRTQRQQMPDDRKLADSRATSVYNEAYYLPDPQEVYFQTWSRLKHAEALSRQGKPKEAIDLYGQIEGNLGTLLHYQERLAWRKESFYAELYFEWAIALLSQGLDGQGRAYLGCNDENNPRKALYNSNSSDNKFDYGTRQEWIRRGCGQKTIDFDVLLGGTEIEDLFNLDTSSQKSAFEQLLERGEK